MMKNILVYIHPSKEFDHEETETLAKVQIDNMLDLGWERKDIILLTNFPYKYRGVKAIIADDKLYCSFNPTQAKINGILYLFEQGLVNSNEIYFCHDFDHYQLNPITEAEINEQLEISDIGITDYGRMPRWNLSCIFFKKTSQDIWKLLKDYVYKHKNHNEEEALMVLTEKNTQGINNRITKLNISYNLKHFNIRSTYPMADKPIKGVHFHPTPDMIDFFFYGKNKINQVILNDRLIKIFNKHGIR